MVSSTVSPLTRDDELHVEVHDVGAEARRGELERHARARARLEEQVGDGAARAGSGRAPAARPARARRTARGRAAARVRRGERPSRVRRWRRRPCGVALQFGCRCRWSRAAPVLGWAVLAQPGLEDQPRGVRRRCPRAGRGGCAHPSAAPRAGPSSAAAEVRRSSTQLHRQAETARQLGGEGAARRGQDGLGAVHIIGHADQQPGRRPLAHAALERGPVGRAVHRRSRQRAGRAGGGLADRDADAARAVVEGEDDLVRARPRPGLRRGRRRCSGAAG